MYGVFYIESHGGSMETNKLNNIISTEIINLENNVQNKERPVQLDEK
jgi:hypothetical protein